MKRAPRLHDLSDNRKTRHRSGREVRGALRQIDWIQHLLGSDEVGVGRSVAAGQRRNVVRDRPSLLGRQGFGERRHRRSVEPRRHRPEDVLSGRTATESPALRKVCRANRLRQLVHQRWRRRSIAPAEIAVALHAAGVHVELLPEFNRCLCGSRRARQLHRLRDTVGVREVGVESLDVVSEVRQLRVGEIRPGRHRCVRHAASDDVDEILLRRQRSVGRRADLELTRRKVARLGEEMRRRVAFAIPVVAVALRAVLEVQGLARLSLRIGPEVGTLRAQLYFRRAHRPRIQQRDEQDRNTRDEAIHHCACSSRARGLSPVNS